MNKQISIILTSVFFLTFMFGFTISAQSQVTIETGKFVLNEKTPGYLLSRGRVGGEPSGERKVTKEVRFVKKFDNEPSVVISVLGLDSRTSDRNLRYRAEAKYVSREGFVIQITTWHDSEIISIEGNWTAISN